jgi:hypothetical protein
MKPTVSGTLRVGIGLLLTAGVAACTTSTPPHLPSLSGAAPHTLASASVAPSSAAAYCAAGQTQVHLDKRGGPVSQQSWAFFSFTNTSRMPCTVAGYPSANLYDERGPIAISQIDGLAYPVNDPRIHPIRLAPNATAYFAVGWSAGNQGYGGSTQGCLTTTRVDVFLPNSMASSSVQARLTNVCPDGRVQPRLEVTAVAFEAAFAALGGPTP